MTNGKKSQQQRLGIFCIISLLLLCNVKAELLIVSGDMNLSVLAPTPSNTTNTTEEQRGLTEKQYDELVLMVDQLIKNNQLTQKQLDHLIAQENYTERRFDNYDNALDKVTDTNKRLGQKVDTLSSDLEESRDQQMIAQDARTRYETVFWVALFIVFIVGVWLARIYYVFKKRGKTYWLVNWIRTLNPFRIPPPDPDEIKHKIE